MLESSSFGGSISRIFGSNLELAFLEEVSQNSCIFRSWTFTAGVFGVVSAMNLSHIHVHQSFGE